MSVARLASLVLVLALCGCAQLSFSSCPAGLHQAQIAELFFGRDIGASEGVSDGDWEDFVNKEIAPRLPGGFTIGDATGQWRTPDGKTVTERSKRLVAVGADRTALAAIRDAYKTRFHQDSVLEVEQDGCAGF